MSSPEVDVLEVLTKEKQNVFKDLLFANKCLNILIEFKTFVDLVFNKFKSDIDLNDFKKYQELCLRVEDLTDKRRFAGSDEDIGQSVVNSTDLSAEDCGQKRSIDSGIEVSPKRPKKSSKTSASVVRNADKSNETNEWKQRSDTELRVGQHSSVTDRPFKCSICKKKFGFRGTTKRHLRVIHEVTDNFTQLIQTCAESDDSEEDEVSEYKCNVCEKVWDTKRKMSKHMRQVHGIDNPLRRRNRGSVPAVVNELRFRCSYEGCGKAFVSKDYLYRHETSTHGERRYACEWPGCEYRATMKQYIREHMEGVHTTERPFACTWPQCDKRFKTILTMRRHLEAHSPDKRFVCSWPGCQYATPCHNSLRRHEMIHTKEKPFSCEWPGCEYRSAYKTEVIRHRSVHSSERNFLCDIIDCGKRFKTKDSLCQHKQIHVSPYVCCVKSCSTHFPTHEELDQHMSQTHPERTIPCIQEGCTKKFETDRLLSRHLLYVHQQTEQWKCDYPGCEFITGFKGSFKRHRESVH